MRVLLLIIGLLSNMEAHANVCASGFIPLAQDILPLVTSPVTSADPLDTETINRTFPDMHVKLKRIYDMFQSRAIQKLRRQTESAIVRDAVSRESFFSANVNGRFTLHLVITEERDLLTVTIDDLRPIGARYGSSAVGKNWIFAYVAVSIIDGLAIRLNEQPHHFTGVKFSVADVTNKPLAKLLAGPGFELHLRGEESPPSVARLNWMYLGAPFFAWPRTFETVLAVAQ